MLYTYPDQYINELAASQRGTDNKRYIYILLLRYPDTFSKIFRLFARVHYNHASIGVSDSDGVFYSYVTTGFRKELPKKHPTFKNHEVPCRLYRVEVSDEVYNVAQTTLEDHAEQAHKFKYSSFGLFLCIMRIVYKRKHQYFCSQFVSETLEQLKAVPLEKHSALYLPDDFTKMEGLDLWFSGYLSELVGMEKQREPLAA